MCSLDDSRSPPFFLDHTARVRAPLLPEASTHNSQLCKCRQDKEKPPGRETRFSVEKHLLTQHATIIYGTSASDSLLNTASARQHNGERWGGGDGNCIRDLAGAYRSLIYSPGRVREAHAATHRAPETKARLAVRPIGAQQQRKKTTRCRRVRGAKQLFKCRRAFRARRKHDTHANEFRVSGVGFLKIYALTSGTIVEATNNISLSLSLAACCLYIVIELQTTPANGPLHNIYYSGRCSFWLIGFSWLHAGKHFGGALRCKHVLTPFCLWRVPPIITTQSCANIIADLQRLLG